MKKLLVILMCLIFLVGCDSNFLLDDDTDSNTTREKGVQSTNGVVIDEAESTTRTTSTKSLYVMQTKDSSNTKTTKTTKKSSTTVKKTSTTKKANTTAKKTTTKKTTTSTKNVTTTAGTTKKVTTTKNANNCYDAGTLTETCVYNAMVALKKTYPDGTPWDNGTCLDYQASNFSINGCGCVSFAFLLSDAAFGTKPATKITDFTNYTPRVGDIIKIYNNKHMIVVLKVNGDKMTVAEGNYNHQVRWMAEYSAKDRSGWTYAYTRWD